MRARTFRDPIAKGVDAISLNWFALLTKIGALTGLTIVILVLLHGQTRIFCTMSQDGLSPPLFAREHAHLQTPHLSQMLIWHHRRDRRRVDADLRTG